MAGTNDEFYMNGPHQNKKKSTKSKKSKKVKKNIKNSKSKLYIEVVALINALHSTRSSLLNIFSHSVS